jgi:hypothetical protein
MSGREADQQDATGEAGERDVGGGHEHTFAAPSGDDGDVAQHGGEREQSERADRRGDANRGGRWGAHGVTPGTPQVRGPGR